MTLFPKIFSTMREAQNQIVVGNSSHAAIEKRSRILALIAIVFVALNLRAAMTAPSAVFDQIKESISISDTARSIIGMLPPVSFALFGWLAPRLVVKHGLEKPILFSLGMIIFGILGRSFSNSVWIYALCSIFCLGGIGICNVLLPPIIKYHFPNQIGLITSIYTSIIYLSAGLPSFVAVPLTNAVGWRVSTGSWALLAIIAVIPWLFIQKGVQPNPEEQGRTKLPVGRWSVAWAIMIVFSIGAFNSFAMLAWLPEILTKSFNIAQADSGRLMSMFSFIGFFPTIFVPIVLTRFKKPWFVVLFFSLCIIIANLGFLFLPQFAVIWIAAAGTGLTFISVGLTLINLRSRTKFGSASLSGFVQGGGYLLSALGPVTVGWLHELTGGWAASLWLLAGTGVLALVMGLLALKPVYLEDYAKETIG